MLVFHKKQQLYIARCPQHPFRISGPNPGLSLVLASAFGPVVSARSLQMISLFRTVRQRSHIAQCAIIAIEKREKMFYTICSIFSQHFPLQRCRWLYRVFDFKPHDAVFDALQVYPVRKTTMKMCWSTGSRAIETWERNSSSRTSGRSEREP